MGINRPLMACVSNVPDPATGVLILSDITTGPSPNASDAAQSRARPLLMLVLGTSFCIASAWIPLQFAALGMIALGAGMMGSALVLLTLGVFRQRRMRRSLAHASRLIENDPSAVVIADAEGVILGLNTVAQNRFAPDDGKTGRSKSQYLYEMLRSRFANPGNIVYRLQKKAETNGHASDLVATRKGHVVVSAHQIDRKLFSWRLDDLVLPAAEGADSGTVPRLTVGRGGTILFMNAAARKMFGQRARSITHLTTAPVVHGQVTVLDGAEGKISCLVAEISLSGGRREILFLPPPEDQPQATSSDFDGLPVPLLKINTSGTVTRANSEALRLLGRDDARDVRLSDLMEGLGRPVTDWLTDAAAGRDQNPSEFLRISRSDKEVFVQVALKRVIESGRPALIAILNDATELKTLEAQFVQSQKMQAIGQLAGGVAHDFNNLLTAISGHCDLLLLRHDQGDADYGDLVQINQNANRAAALVGQLLAFSRKQTLRPEVLDLRDTLSDLTHLLNRLVGERVSLTLDHDPVLRTIRADKRQLEQVMMNLVVNARDAMPEGGEIRIKTEGLTLETPLKRDRAVVGPGDYVLVKVQDEGCGIAPDMLQKIFEPFVTTKKTGEGTGLGLSTVYGIVKQTGGFIFVDSVVGQGACFSLLFPVHAPVEEIEAAQEKPKEVAVAARPDAVVLLVEDEAPVRAFASRALRLRGFSVLEADSAEAALKMLEDPTVEVDVFVTDVVMPGLDGPTWVREALKKRPEVKVVFVSGYAEENFHDDQSAIPNSTFLPKPFSLVELTDTVYRQLH